MPMHPIIKLTLVAAMLMLLPRRSSRQADRPSLNNTGKQPTAAQSGICSSNRGDNPSSCPQTVANDTEQ